MLFRLGENNHCFKLCFLGEVDQDDIKTDTTTEEAGRS
jgi:hypothetical protein